MSASPVSMQRKKEYGRLLAQVLPSVIHTEKQHAACLKTLEALLERERSLTAAERELASLLTLLIEDFEDRHYSLPTAAPEPKSWISSSDEQHDFEAKRLARCFWKPQYHLRNPERETRISKEHIRRLSARFHLSPEALFF